jgi:hypothetical protein
MGCATRCATVTAIGVLGPFVSRTVAVVVPKVPRCAREDGLTAAPAQNAAGFHLQLPVRAQSNMRRSIAALSSSASLTLVLLTVLCTPTSLRYKRRTTGLRTHTHQRHSPR